MRRRWNEPGLPLLEDAAAASVDSFESCSMPSPEPEPSIAVTSGSRVGQLVVVVLLGAVAWVVLSGPTGPSGSSVPPALRPTRVSHGWTGVSSMPSKQGLDGEGGEPRLTIVTAADQRVDLPLPSAFDGRAWINSIAVPTSG